MKSSSLILLWLIAVVGAACKKQTNLASAPIKQDDELEILWEIPLITANWQTSIAMTPILIDSLVVFSTEFDIAGYKAPILFLDPDSGSVVDGWDQYINGASPIVEYNVVSDGNYLVLGAKGDLNCIDLVNRDTKWRSTFSGYAGPFTYLNDGLVFYPVEDWSQKVAVLYKCEIQTGQWDTLFSLRSTNGYIPNFAGMGFGESANGDKLAFWKNRGFKAKYGQTDIYAYNLTADSLLWVNTDFSVGSGANPLIVDGTKVYGVIKNKVFALDKTNGKLVWERDFEWMAAEPSSANFDLGAIIQLKDYLVLKGHGPELVYLRKGNGSNKQIITLPDGEGIKHFISVFEGKFFISTTSGLFIVEAQSGRILFENLKQERFQFQNVSTGYCIDSVRRVMYFTNGRHAFCAKIPDLE